MGAFSSLTQDIRHAGRRLRSEPGFALVAIVTMALGIAVSAAMFSVFDGVLLRPLPWPEADRIVRIEERRGGVRGRTPWTVTNGTYNAWRDSTATLEGLGGWMSTSQILRSSGDPERLVVAAATPSLFAVLRARPEVGRLFLEGDADFGEVGRAILAFGLWQERFAGDRAVIGRTISLDDRTYEIVGVMPREFAFPDRETSVWVPFRPLPLMSRDGRQMRVIVMSALARLAPGVTPAQAAAEGTARARTVPDIRQAALSVFGSKGELNVAVAPALGVLTGEVRPVLGLVVFAVVLLLAAATANVVSLQLARATTRRREMAIRTAIGAGFWRLIRLWLVESALLGLCAGIAGVAVAGALCRLLPAWLPADFPRLDDITLDARSMLFSMTVTALVSIVCGSVPMLMTWRARLASVLGDSASAVGLAMRTPISRLRTLIMIGQVAIACVLLVGGTLLARSFMRMVEADRGYEPSNLLTARLTFRHLEQDQRRVQILETLQQRLRAIPEVRDVAFGNGLPFVNAGNVFGRIIPSPRDPSAKLQIGSTWRVVSPEYGTALQLRVVAGRPLASTDTASSPGVIVVNRSFARDYLGSDAIGQRLQLGLSSQLEWEVVGVVDDVRQGHVTEPARPEFFVSYRQVPDGIAFDPMVLLRTNGDPTALTPAMRDVIRRVDPLVVLDSVMTMEDRLMASLGRPRAYALVLGGLAVLALVIAGVGLFGVLSYTTAQRRPEIGIRVALGAASRDIVRLVVGQGAMLIGTGLVVGLTLTLLSAGLLSKFVYGISARDAISFTVAPIMIAGVGIIACAVPARRAIRTDPADALRVN